MSQSIRNQAEAEENKFPYCTNYYVAVHWCNNHFILCNSIPQVDFTVYDNAEFDLDNTEIYQWFLSDCSYSEKEFLQKHFPNLHFTYSDKLDVWVLAVDHFGTAWTYVGAVTDLKRAVRELGERE